MQFARLGVYPSLEAHHVLGVETDDGSRLSLFTLSNRHLIILQLISSPKSVPAHGLSSDDDFDVLQCHQHGPNISTSINVVAFGNFPWLRGMKLLTGTRG